MPIYIQHAFQKTITLFQRILHVDHLLLLIVKMTGEKRKKEEDEEVEEEEEEEEEEDEEEAPFWSALPLFTSPGNFWLSNPYLIS